MENGRREGYCNAASRRAVVWLCALGLSMLLAHRTSAESCKQPLSVNVTIFPTGALQCRDSGFSPDNSANNFIVWSMKDNSSGVVSIVVAAPLGARQWAGLGFSGPGMMTGATAVVATLGAKGVQATQYYLQGMSPELVVRNNTRIRFEAGPELFYDAATTTVHMAFQIDFAASKAVLPNFLLFAQGPATGVDNADLTQHTARFMQKSQFPAGEVGESAASKLATKVKAHGAVMVFGWGVLLPIGAMVARYARGFDPAWFYIHMAFQMVGFVFIIAGIALGVDAAKSIHVPHLDGHKGLGAFVFTLAILQVLAVVLRPGKDAKGRKYWNWYHWWVGRMALFFACINIFVGLSLEEGGDRLKTGYIVLLVLELLAFAVLELLYWLRWNRNPSNSSAMKWNRAVTDRGIQLEA